jgi:hypothetical protein
VEGWGEVFDVVAAVVSVEKTIVLLVVFVDGSEVGHALALGLRCCGRWLFVFVVVNDASSLQLG